MDKKEKYMNSMLRSKLNELENEWSDCVVNIPSTVNSEENGNIHLQCNPDGICNKRRQSSLTRGVSVAILKGRVRVGLKGCAALVTVRFQKT